MISIPEEIKNLFRSDNISAETRKKFKLSFYDKNIDTLYPYETLYPEEALFPSESEEPWLVIENDRIESESLTITEALSESEELEFGSCESSSIEIVTADVEQEITGKEFILSVEIGGYEIVLGAYTVESFVRQADRRKRKITAYDRMRRFNVDVSGWYNELNFPMTLKSFRDSLCEYIGIEQEFKNLVLDSLEISKTIEPEEISGLDVLKAICQINGCFGHVNKMGLLEYITLQNTGLYPSEELFPFEELYPSETGGDGEEVEAVSTYKSLTYEDYLVQGISGLTIREQEGDVGASVGDGENPYIIEGNFLVYGKTAIELLHIAQSVYELIYGRTYRPAKLECSAMPWLEPGDFLIAPTREDIVETFLMKRVTKGCQAMMDTIESTGSEKREEVFGINKKIIQLEGKSAVIEKNVEEVSVRVTDLKAQEEAHFSVTSSKIESEVKRATEAEGNLSSSITQTANSITAEVARAKREEEKLSARITVNATEISLRVSKGKVSSEISAESDQVTISSNRLVVNSTNFSLTKEGLVTCNGIVSTNGKYSGIFEVAAETSAGLNPVRIKVPGTDDDGNIYYTYFVAGTDGFLVARNRSNNRKFIRMHVDTNDGIPTFSGGSFSSFSESSWTITGIDEQLKIHGDGEIKTPWTYNNKGSSEANVHISSGGILQRTGSSARRYKKDITEDISEANVEALYDLPVVLFKYIDGYLADGDPAIGKNILGFIADDVAKYFPKAVVYEDGKIENWNSRIMIPAILKLVQEQNRRIVLLEDEICK